MTINGDDDPCIPLVISLTQVSRPSQTIRRVSQLTTMLLLLLLSLTAGSLASNILIFTGINPVPQLCSLFSFSLALTQSLGFAHHSHFDWHYIPWLLSLLFFDWHYLSILASLTILLWLTLPESFGYTHYSSLTDITLVSWLHSLFFVDWHYLSLLATLTILHWLTLP